MKRIYWMMTLTVLLFACNRKAEKAADYNDNINRLQYKVMEKINDMDSSLVEYDADQLEIAHLELKAEIRRSLQGLRDLGPFTQDSALYTASEDLFKFYKEVSDEEYERVVEIMSLPDSSFTAAEQEHASAIFDTIQVRFETQHEDFKKVQQNFIEEYRLTVEEE
jgi:glutathione peroxidase-family protein